MNLISLNLEKKKLEESRKQGEVNNISSKELEQIDYQLDLIEEKIFTFEKLIKFGIGSRFTEASVDDFSNSDIKALITRFSSEEQNHSAINIFDYSQSYVNRFLEEVLNTGESIVLSGPAGIGKTHLACAIAIACRKSFMNAGTGKDFIIKFSVASELSAKFSSYNYNADSEINICATTNLLIIDDMAAEVLDTERGLWVNEQLINRVIRPRYNNCLPTIITTNASMDDFCKMYGSRASTIFQGKTYSLISMFGDKDLRSF